MFFFEKIGNLIDFLKTETVLSSITTSSPVIAKFLKRNFPDLECRASVNMEIGTIQGMEYLADWFDGVEVDFDSRLEARRRDVLRRLRSMASKGKASFASRKAGSESRSKSSSKRRAAPKKTKGARR